MNQPVWSGTGRSSAPEPARPTSSSLADILERVLDKGIVIAGDIRIDLLDIELLTIKIRLVVASVDRAKEMGIDWWERDRSLSSRAPEDGDERAERDVQEENRRLRQRIGDLEAQRLAEPELEPGPGTDGEAPEIDDGSRSREQHESRKRRQASGEGDRG